MYGQPKTGEQILSDNFRYPLSEHINRNARIKKSESMLYIVRTYIDNQVSHQQKKTFMEEYNEFIKKYEFQKFG